MRVKLSRALVGLAARLLGPRRRSWGEAMRVELETAIDDGRPFTFAAGCLVAAARQLPTYAEGRFAMAAHALALGLIVPLGAVSLWAGVLGYPYLSFGNIGLSGFIAGRSEQIPLLTYGEWGLAPALTLVVLLHAVGQLLLAWFLLDRDWTRVEAFGRFLAATLTTLLIVTSLLAVIDTSMFLVVAALVTETLAVLALGWWHEHLPPDSPAAFETG